VVAFAIPDGRRIAPQELNVLPIIEVALRHKSISASAEAPQETPQTCIGCSQFQPTLVSFKPEVVGSGRAPVLQVKNESIQNAIAEQNVFT
jgi:hypothetical protein